MPVHLSARPARRELIRLTPATQAALHVPQATFQRRLVQPLLQHAVRALREHTLLMDLARAPHVPPAPIQPCLQLGPHAARVLREHSRISACMPARAVSRANTQHH